MRDSKLYKTLVNLSAPEINRLHKFILSPYFNQNQSIVNLFEWIKLDIRNATNHPVNKEQIWKICFGNTEEYNDGRLRKLQSDLLKLTEGFYAYEVFRSDPIHETKFLLDAIYHRRLEHLQTGALKGAKDVLKAQELRDASYYYYHYEIEKSTYFLSLEQSQRSAKSNIEDIVQNLDRFYLAEKLRYISFILTHQHFVAVDYKMLFTDEILNHLSNSDYTDVPAVIVYYQILLTYKEPNNRNHYEKLIEYYNSFIHLFPQTEAKEILDAALNYCIIKMNSGEEEYVREAFNLYMSSLENEIIFVKGHITPWSFKNIVTIGLRLKEFDKIEHFISTYSLRLEEKYRENSITFNFAQLYFYRKEYSKVIEQLSRVEYDDFTYNLNSKTLLMASYFELDEIEALNSLLDAFRIYVTRNKKLTKGKSSHYLNTISLVRKLAKIKMGDTVQIEKLRKQVLETKGIVSRNWILEKLDALKN